MMSCILCCFIISVHFIYRFFYSFHGHAYFSHFMISVFKDIVHISFKILNFWFLFRDWKGSFSSPWNNIGMFNEMNFEAI